MGSHSYHRSLWAGRYLTQLREVSFCFWRHPWTACPVGETSIFSWYSTFSSLQSLSNVQLFETPWTAGRQTSLSITNSWSLLKLTSIKLVLPSNHLILCHPLLLLPSIPESGSFPRSQFFAKGEQSIGASAPVLPMNIRDWFPLGLTGCISLQSKGLSRVSSNTTVWKHQFFNAQLSLWSNSHHTSMTTEKP